MESFYHIIIAGGSGSRFWPKSKKNKPKQLLKITNDKTMIRLTYERIANIANPKNILVIASKELCQHIQIETPEIPKENFIIEPSGKNTAPAIGLAAIHILKRDKNALMGIYPADHLISENDKFYNTITKAEKIISNQSCLVTIGIKPTYSATGYGYIHFDKSEKQNIQNSYKVINFTEKPTKQNADKFITNGNYLWNAGIFAWKAKTLLSEMENHMPDLHKNLLSIYDAIGNNNYKQVLNSKWHEIISKSIDYGILEKSNNIYTIAADFKWNDLGSWKSLFDILPKNKDKNHYEGDVISLQSNNNLVISPNRLTAVIGIKDLTIINLDDATLIMPHEKAEEVKNIVEMLKSLNNNKYL